MARVPAKISKTDDLASGDRGRVEVQRLSGVQPSQPPFHAVTRVTLPILHVPLVVLVVKESDQISQDIYEYFLSQHAFQLEIN